MIYPEKRLSLRICLSFLTVFLLILSLFPAVTGNGEEAEGSRKLIVGTTNAMQGDFLNGMFSNGTSDIDVRNLIHGYNLVNWDNSQGIYNIDSSVVKDTMVLDNDAGDRTYYLILQDELYYSDGTEITTWDYAFSLLLGLSPVVEEIGGHVLPGEHIQGGAAYTSGESDILSGVKILSDRQLSITLDHTCLPYFQEQGLLMCEPFPISVIAPGCKVYDDGEGVYIGNAERKDLESPFTAELLQETLLGENGYLSHPSISSGPYVLVSYDGKTAEFEKNTHYKGNAAGKNATIDKLAYTVVPAEKVPDEMKNGRIHLINKLVYEEAVTACIRAKYESETYGRTGLTMITFSCEMPTVAEKEVRQAIAWCLDRDALSKAYCGDSAVRVDGYYGRGQWEYQLAAHLISAPGQLEEVENAHKDTERTAAEVWNTLNLNNLTAYHVDTVKANALLDKAGWTLNNRGETYDARHDEVRCKKVNGELVALDLKLLYANGNHIVDTMRKNFINNLNRCGIRLTLVPETMENVAKAWYRQTERDTDMIYMGTNFYIVADPAQDFVLAGITGQGDRNYTNSADEDLYWRAVSMRQTEPQDIYGYMTKWVAFQERFNEVLPGIPIYSSDYYDFWVTGLSGYDIRNHKTWAQAILGAEFK